MASMVAEEIRCKLYSGVTAINLGIMGDENC